MKIRIKYRTICIKRPVSQCGGGDECICTQYRTVEKASKNITHPLELWGEPDDKEVDDEGEATTNKTDRKCIHDEDDELNSDDDEELVDDNDGDEDDLLCGEGVEEEVMLLLRDLINDCSFLLSVSIYIHTIHTHTNTLFPSQITQGFPYSTNTTITKLINLISFPSFRFPFASSDLRTVYQRKSTRMAANAIPAVAVTAMAMPTLEPPPSPRPRALALAKEIRATMRPPPVPAEGWCIKRRGRMVVMEAEPARGRCVAGFRRRWRWRWRWLC